MPPSKDIIQWVDEAMYESQPMLRSDEERRIQPKVFMLSGTPDPLGVLAADMRMYRGDPVYSLSEITDEQRRWAWEELMKTHLNTPLEGVQVKFMIEAVTRSFTHQMVRQRVGAYYVQESLRFAVKRGLAKEVALPPSIVPGSEGETAMKIWQDTVEAIDRAYNQLVDAGIPAEDARGLLPHATTTRIIYTTNLRALFEHAGNRLCTQAQFEWRSVFLGIMKAIRDYDPDTPGGWAMGHQWQWQEIATPLPFSFTPICYRKGTCAFMSELDRGCSIRDRVLAFADEGVKSSEWASPKHGDQQIRPEEWMADPTAGITTDENKRPER